MHLHTISPEQTGFRGVALPPERESPHPKGHPKAGCQAGHQEPQTPDSPRPPQFLVVPSEFLSTPRPLNSVPLIFSATLQSRYFLLSRTLRLKGLLSATPSVRGTVRVKRG